MRLQIIYKLLLSVVSIAVFSVVLWFALDWYLLSTQYAKQRLQWSWVLGLEGDETNSVITNKHEFISDARLIYRSKPNVPDITDAYGFRLQSSDTKIATDTKKKILLTLGDSTTWGDSVNNYETYPYHLSQRLSDYTVINAGTRSYGPDQEYLYFKDVIVNTYGIKPYMLIWTLYINDINDMVYFPLFIPFQNRLIQIPGWINGMYIVRQLLQYLPVSIVNSRPGNFLLNHIQHINLVRIAYNSPTKKTQFAQDKLRLLIQQMMEFCAQYNIRLILVMAPNQGVLMKHPDTIELYTNLKSALENIGIEYIDVHEIFISNRIDGIEKKIVEQDRYAGATISASMFNLDSQESSPEIWKHLSSTGNKFFADMLYTYITDSQSLP